MNSNCYPPSPEQLLSSIGCILGNSIDSEGGFLCDPDTGLPILVRYKFSFSGGVQTSIVVDAWNLDGTSYTGDKTALISCVSGGGGGSSLGVVEYFICDNGVQKIVQLCGTTCGGLTVTYLLLNRTTSTTPSDWSLVKAGPCLTAESSWTNGTASITRITSGTDSSGTIAAGKYSVSFANVGSASGNTVTVAGQPLYYGQTVEFTAYEDPVTHVLGLLPAITYSVAGAGILSISVMGL